MNGISVRPGSLVGASRGPILLITLGILFAIDHAGSYSIGRTWPVLVIVFGVMKLVERMSVRATDIQ